MTKSILRICGFALILLSICLMPVLSGCESEKVYSTDKVEGPFVVYDTAIKNSVMYRWSNLEHAKWPAGRHGKIVLQFHLNQDGTVSEMKTVEDSVGAGQAIICQTAIYDVAPFPRWPPDMVRMIGADYRVVTFSFYYSKGPISHE